MTADPPSAPRASVEVERTYDVDLDLAVPDLQGLPGVARVSEPEELRLEAVYVDTPDLRLRAAGITLRHRTGGTDDGWTLKLPAGDDREEVTVDAGPGPVPEALAALVRAHVRRRPLAPVVTLSTRRIVRRLLDDSGQPLAEIADDTVTGRVLPEAPEQRGCARGAGRARGCRPRGR